MDDAPFLIAAQVDSAVWAVLGTLAGALVTGIVGFLSARATRQASQEPTKAADHERFAQWQVQKRTVYGEFLQAGHVWAENPASKECRLSFLGLRAQVLLLANKAAAEAVRKIRSDGEGLSETRWDELAIILRTDALQPSERYNSPG